MLTINYRDPRPIYVQIMDGLRRLIISEVLLPDERIPSVREQAAALAINPNTIQRAYRELENEGYIYSVPGKGSFVGIHQEVDQARRDTLLRQVDEAAAELEFLGMSREALAAHIVGKEEKPA